MLFRWQGRVGNCFTLLSQQHLNELLILRRREFLIFALGVLRHPAERTCGIAELCGETI
jgi:hypothetical protein